MGRLIIPETYWGYKVQPNGLYFEDKKKECFIDHHNDMWYYGRTVWKGAHTIPFMRLKEDYIFGTPLNYDRVTWIKKPSPGYWDYHKENTQ